MDIYWDGSNMDPSYYDYCCNENEENSASGCSEEINPELKIIQNFSTNPRDIKKFQSLQYITDEHTLYSLITYVKLHVFFSIIDGNSDNQEICSLAVHILSILLKHSSSKIFDETFLEFLLTHQKLEMAPLLYYPIHDLVCDKNMAKIIIDICNEILESIDYDDSVDENSVNQVRFLLLTIYDYSCSIGSINIEIFLDELSKRIIDEIEEVWKPCIGPFYKLLSVISLTEQNFENSYNYILNYVEEDFLDPSTQDSIEGALEYIYSYIKQNEEIISSENYLENIMNLMFNIRFKLDSIATLLQIVEFLATRSEIFYQSEPLLDLLLDSFNEADLITETRIYIFNICFESFPRDQNWTYKQSEIYDRIILNSDKLEEFQTGNSLVKRIRAEYKSNIRRKPF